MLLDGDAACMPLHLAEEECSRESCAWYAENCELPAWYEPNTLRCNVCFSRRSTSPGGGFRTCGDVLFEKKSGAWTYKYLRMTSIT